MTPLKHWFQNRFGWLDIRKTLLDRKIPSPGKWGWFYTLGSATLAVFLLQVVTGMLLGMNYSPSPDHAYESINYIMTQIPAGKIIRGLHHWGASAMVVLVVLHMIRVFFMASYKAPRELTWILGIGLLIVTFGLGFTGYLLPWDQKAYWATSVGINIAEQAPFFGHWIAKILKGGEELGALTLTRFYGLHVLILPASLVLLVALHLFLVIYHGISAPPHPRGTPPPDYAEQKEKGKSFYPHSVFKDVVAVTILFALLFFLASYFGVDLEDPADPNDTSYNPRPDWYFLFLFQMLKLFPGSLEALAAIVFPTLIIIFLVLLPFLERGDKRHPLARPVWMGGGFLAVGFVVWLSWQGWKSPLVNPQIERSPMVLQGKEVYAKLHCAYCHRLRGEGGDVGPELTFAVAKRSDEWLADHFRKPKEATPGSTMPELHLLDEEIYGLIAYLRDVAGSQTLGLKTAKVFAETCLTCHRLRGKGEDIGPDLSQIGSFREKTWIQAYMENPQALNPDSVMPGFAQTLSPEDLESIALYLASQKGR